MKKYSFILWILILALIIGGGYYVVNTLGNQDKDKPVVTDIETPTETGIAGEEENDYISQLKIDIPFQTDFIAYNGQGEKVSISDYRGKNVILNFWASWCPPCVEEMPEFEALHKKLDPKDTVILAINVTDGQRETRKTAEKFIREQNIDLNILYDEDLNGAKEFSISVIPQTYVIDKEGYVQYGLMGMTDEVVLSAILERMK